MKNLSRTLGFVLAIALSLVSASLAVAQNRERFGISAKAGGVNVVLGRVMVTRKGQAPQLLSSNDDLASGDLITTGSLSQTEVLLNPGTYFRVGENSEFLFEDSSLDNLRLKLVRGSAIIEAAGLDGVDLDIDVVTSQANFTILRSGVYRINAEPNFAELAVRKGRASFGVSKTDLVKGGNKVTFQNGAMARSKVDKDKDAFEVWSKQRAELLARANERLSRRVFNGYLATMTDDWGGGFMGRRRLGIWTFSPRAGCYTFLPYFYGMSSPYGHYYGRFHYPGGGGCCNGWYPNNGQNPTVVNNQTHGTGGSGSGSGGNPGRGINPTPAGGGNPTPPPTFNPPLRELDPYGGGRQVRKQDP